MCGRDFQQRPSGVLRALVAIYRLLECGTRLLPSVLTAVRFANADPRLFRVIRVGVRVDHPVIADDCFGGVDEAPVVDVADKEQRLRREAV